MDTLRHRIEKRLREEICPACRNTPSDQKCDQQTDIMRGSKFMRKYHVRIEIHAQPFANIMRGSKFMRKYHVRIEIHAQPSANIMRGSKFMRKYHVRIEIHAQPFANIMGRRPGTTN